MPLSTPKLKAIGFASKYKDELVKKHIVKYTPDGYDNKDENNGYVELIHDRVAKTIVLRRKNYKKNRRNKVQRLLLLLFIFITTVAGLKLGLRTKFFTGYDTREMVSESFIYPDDLIRDKQIPKYISRLCVNSLPKTLSIRDIALLEEIIIESSNSLNHVGLNISDCERLNSVIFPDDTKSLSFTVEDSNNLRYIKLPDSLSEMSLSLYPTNNIFIDVPASIQDKFLYQDGVLWDLVNKSILFVNSKKDTVIVLFPEQLETGDSIIRYTRWSPYRTVQVVNGKGKSPVIDINDTTISAIDLYDTDTLDLSTAEYDHISIIAEQAFADCKSLRYIVLPRNLKEIKERAFEGCIMLEQVLFPESLKKIGLSAFKGCVSLKTVDLSRLKGAVDIGARAFEGCQTLTNAKFSSKVYFDKSRIINCDYYDQFFGCNILTSIFIGDSLTPNEGVFFFDKIPLHAIKGFSYKDDKYITEDGVLYSKEHFNGMEFLLPFLSHKEFSWKIPHSNGGLILNGARVTYLPINPNIICYNSNNIEELHSATIYPGNLYGLTDQEKKHITLFVPYGCKKYYILDKDYKSFKDIKEDPLSLRIKNMVKEMVEMTNDVLFVYNLKQGVPLFFGVILLVIISVIFRFGYKVEYKNIGGKSNVSKQIWSKLLIKSLLVFVLFLVTWISFYWLLYFMLENNIFNNLLSSVVSHVLGIGIAIFFAWTIVYYKSGDVFEDIREKLYGTWLVFRNASVKELSNSIYTSIQVFIRRKNLIYYILIVLFFIISILSIHFVKDSGNKRSHKIHEYVEYISDNDGLSYEEIRRSEQIFDEVDVLDIHVSSGLIAHKKFEKLLISNIFTGEVYKSYSFSSRIHNAYFDDNADKLLVATRTSLFCINLHTDQKISLDESLGYGAKYKFSMGGNYIIGYTDDSLKAYIVKNIFSKRNQTSSELSFLFGYKSQESIKDADISSNGSDIVVLTSRSKLEFISILSDGTSEKHDVKSFFGDCIRYNKKGNLLISNGGIYNKYGIRREYIHMYAENIQFTQDGSEIVAIEYDGTISLLDAESLLYKMCVKVDKKKMFYNNTNYYNGKTMIVYKDGYFIEIAPKSFEKMQEEYNSILSKE